MFAKSQAPTNTPSQLREIYWVICLLYVTGEAQMGYLYNEDASTVRVATLTFPAVL
jgi:hypothetical protein